MKHPILYGALFFPWVVLAQHEHSGPMESLPQKAPLLELNGSGTSRLPEATPMYAVHSNVGSWNLMTHGSLLLRYTRQNANNTDKRSDDEIDFPNWLMLMGTRELLGGESRLDLRGMFSLDRLTEGGNGYPLLFATGETWRGQPLVDRQHPHDLFMELAAIYSHRLGEGNQIFLYLGMPGEPALGPTAYMHRPSNQTNPDAVISHHNQDATHITFGVATVGWMNRLIKVDASLFTGREPDEDRYDFDRPRFDSYSLRFSFNPTRFLSSQLSAGFLKGPEALEPDEDQVRVTASLDHVQPFAEGKFLSSSIVYGGNSHVGEEGGVQNAFTLESEWDWNLGTLYGRLEAVQKSGEDLAIAPLDEEEFWTNGFTLGSSIRLFRKFQMQTVLGAQGTFNLPEKDLRPFYGDFPLSFEIFLKISPDLMVMGMKDQSKGAGGQKEQGKGNHGGHPGGH